MNPSYAEKQARESVRDAIATLRKANSNLSNAATEGSGYSSYPPALLQLFNDARRSVDDAVRKLMDTEGRLDDFDRKTEGR